MNDPPLTTPVKHQLNLCTSSQFLKEGLVESYSFYGRKTTRTPFTFPVTGLGRREIHTGSTSKKKRRIEWSKLIVWENFLVKILGGCPFILRLIGV